MEVPKRYRQELGNSDFYAYVNSMIELNENPNYKVKNIHRFGRLMFFLRKSIQMEGHPDYSDDEGYSEWYTDAFNFLTEYIYKDKDYSVKVLGVVWNMSISDPWHSMGSLITWKESMDIHLLDYKKYIAEKIEELNKRSTTKTFRAVIDNLGCVSYVDDNNVTFAKGFCTIIGNIKRLSKRRFEIIWKSTFNRKMLDGVGLKYSHLFQYWQDDVVEIDASACVELMCLISMFMSADLIPDIVCMGSSLPFTIISNLDFTQQKTEGLIAAAVKKARSLRV
jgi:hypothetical protein